MSPPSCQCLPCTRRPSAASTIRTRTITEAGIIMHTMHPAFITHVRSNIASTRRVITRTTVSPCSACVGVRSSKRIRDPQCGIRSPRMFQPRTSPMIRIHMQIGNPHRAVTARRQSLPFHITVPSHHGCSITCCYRNIKNKCQHLFTLSEHFKIFIMPLITRLLSAIFHLHKCILTPHRCTNRTTSDWSLLQIHIL